MNLEKVKSITNRIMDVNRKLADLGETKIPINFIGMAGVGKRVQNLFLYCHRY